MLRRPLFLMILVSSAWMTAAAQSGTHHGDGVEEAEFVTSPSYLKRGPSLRGVDPVALIDQGQVVLGKKEIRYRARGGFLYLFANPENLATFKDNQEKYLPAFDGRCPVTYHTIGRKRPGDPNFFSVYQNKLYLFINRDAYDQFVEQPDAVLASLAGE